METILDVKNDKLISDMLTAETGVKIVSRYQYAGSMKNTLLIHAKANKADGTTKNKWYGNKAVQDIFRKYFLQFDGNELNDFSGNGGLIQVYCIPR